MRAEREDTMRRMPGISIIAAHQKSGMGESEDAIHLSASRRTASRASARPLGAPLSPLLLSVMLIGAQGLLIVACNLVLAFIGEGERGTPDYHEAAIGGLGVAVLFMMIRPMIRLSTAGSSTSFDISVSGTLAALALAELAGLGGYAYLAHYFGTSVPPVSFHHWPRAWALAIVVAAVTDITARQIVGRMEREGRLAKRIVVYGGGEQGARFIADALARWPTRLLVRGYFDDREADSREALAGVPCLGSSGELVDYVRGERIDEIVIALP